MGENNKKTRTKKKRKGLKITLIVLLLLIIIIGGIVAGFVGSKISKLEFDHLDEEDLAVNDSLYDEFADEMSYSEFKNIKNIVLFGVDSTDLDYGRSDTIMIVSVNPAKKSIKLISIPRDTYVEVPGYGKTKINHAYAYGKEQLSLKTINNNFRLNITEYATIDFSGLINVINDVGGIELNITKEEQEYINQKVAESYKVSGNSVKTVSSYGRVTLTGEQALTHSRNRTVGNDFTRAGRQREVIEALINKLSSLNMTKLNSTIDILLGEVRTNVNVSNYLGFLTGALLNSSEYTKNIISEQVPSTDYAKGEMIGGVYYFVSDIETAREDLVNYIYRK